MTMNNENNSIQLGLCCMNIGMREQKPSIYASRTCTLKTIKQYGMQVVFERALKNLEDLKKMIKWNHMNNIKVFRLSSDIFPHYSNPQIERYNLDFAKEHLEEIGKMAKEYNMRLTFHPGQYNVLGTKNKQSFDKTLLDLSCHANIIDMMGLDKDTVMVIHGGGVYGNKEETKNRWIENYNELPDNIKRRLVLENCEKCFNIEDCLEIAEKINIPIVFDTHHFDCYSKLHPNENFKEPSYYIPLILNTWKKRGIKPKFHISEQGTGKLGHHSDYIEIIPEYLLEIPIKYSISIDIMIEAKMKEKAVLHLYNKYPQLNKSNNIYDNDLFIKINLDFC